MQRISSTQLTPDEQALLTRASESLQYAYAPYSKYHVGAAIRTNKGSIITGVNMENACFPGAICAERCAVLNANSQGERSFVTLAVIASFEGGDTGEASAPCGICRQVISEFSQISGINTKIIFSTQKQDVIFTTTIEELLPSPFGPKQLAMDVTSFKT